MRGGAFGPRPLRWQDAMAERILTKRHLSDEWRLAFNHEVAALLYEIIHTDCSAGCVCEVAA